jgi:uncharacterized protein YhaN
MRILELDLIACGPFSGETLDLSAGQYGLHIVYGPNESGKTSALRGLGYFLFGFPHQCSDGFLHPLANLRVGGTLEADDGTLVRCVRRKGAKNTLLDAADETPLDPDTLARLLQGVDSDAFCKRFALTHQELVRGGVEIVTGGGDVGRMLFSAGTGVSGLRAVEQALREDLGQLWKAGQAKNPRINQQLAELRRAGDAVRDAQTPSALWIEHDEALRRCESRLREVELQRNEKSAEKSHWERIQNALPVVAELAVVRSRLNALHDVACLAEDFAVRRRDAHDQQTLARAELALVREDAAAIRNSLAALDPPADLLAHADEIDQVHQDLNVYRQAVKDHPLLGGKRRQVADDIVRRAAELGHEDPARIGPLRPQDKVRIQSLGRRYEALIAQLDTARAQSDRTQALIRGLKRAVDESPSPPDIQPIRLALRQFGPLVPLEQRAGALDREIGLASRQADIALGQLESWTGTLEALETLAVPSLETIEHYQAELDVALRDHVEACRRLEEADQRLAEIDRQIADPQGDAPLTEFDLTAARQRRDESWQLVRRAWQENDSDSAEVRAFLAASSAADLAEAYETTVREADEIADHLRRQAVRTAQHARWIADRDRQREQRSRLEKAVSSTSARVDEISAAWQALWSPLGIQPKTPREMRSWRERQVHLATKSAELRAKRHELSDIQRQIEAARRELIAAWNSGSSPLPGTSESLASLVRLAEDALQRWEPLAEKRRDTTREIARLETSFPELAESVRRGNETLASWRQEWTCAIALLELPADTTPDEAQAVLDAIGDIVALLNEDRELSERLAQIEQYQRAYAARVEALILPLAPDLSGAPSDQAVRRLHERLTDARKTADRQQDLGQQLVQLEQKRERAAAGLKRAGALLDALCLEARCQSQEQLAEAEQHSLEKQRLERRREELDAHLARLAAGTPREEFEQQAAAVAADEVAIRLAELASELSQLDQDRKDAIEAVVTHRSALAAMDGSARAAAARQEAEILAAQIVIDVENYARLRLASAILRNAVERHRQRHEGPLVKRAGEIFGELTRQGFARLVVDENDQNQPVLFGVRTGASAAVGVEAMSDGTCDQLYLALRLASLELFLEKHSPIPFIVDDILQRFDDDRAVAALKTLAVLSQRIQVIFFTHHEHLVRLAEENLDNDVVFVHRLGERSESRRSHLALKRKRAGAGIGSE